jgi:hypothetical protein
MNSAVLTSIGVLVEMFSLHFVRYPDCEVSSGIIWSNLVVLNRYWSSAVDIILLGSIAPDQNVHC